MDRLPIALFWLLVALFTGHVASSIESFPDPIATHFGGSGVANGWMPRATYLRFILILGLGMPFFVVGIHQIIASYAGDQFNIPNRAYWLAPQRRAESLAFVVRHGWWLACIMSMFMTAVHALLLVANRASPPRLPSPSFALLVGGFLVGLAVWTLVLHRRFRKPAE